MSHSDTNIPSPPYTYNDFRITYNEKCFFYNGGYDLTCLVVRRPVGVGTAPAGRYPQSYPSPDLINLVFKVCVDYVNDKDYKEEEFCEIKRYSFPSKNNTTVKTVGLDVKRRIIKVTGEHLDIKTIGKLITSTAPIKKDTLKTYVSSSLFLNKPNKLKITSKIIDGKKDEKK